MFWHPIIPSSDSAGGLNVNVELNYYRLLKRRRQGGSLCDGCGRCSVVCPMQLDEAKELKLASEFQNQNSFL